MTDSLLPYGRQWIDEEDIAEVVAILRGDWMTQGPTVAAFEKALAEYCGARFAVAVSNGTAALHLACLAAGVGHGDFGITSPITFVASANCIAYCGGTPSFVDVDTHTISIDVTELERACRQQRPKVIIPVDFSGLPANLPEIHRIARKYDAVVIEDAAHSLGASYESDGVKYKTASCVHADMAILSFHPVKHITTGEGGAILTNDPELYARLSDLRTHGITKDASRLSRNDGPWYHEQQSLGYNYRITDLQCALGISQLRKLDSFVQRRRHLVSLYQQLLSDVADKVSLLTDAPERYSSYHLMVARVNGGATVRRRVFDHLFSKNIRVQVHYIPVPLQPWYRQTLGFSEGQFPNAEAYYETCLSLPLFPAMTDADVERVVTEFRAALNE